MIQEFKAPKTRKFDLFGILGKIDYKRTEFYLREIERAEEATREYLNYLEKQRRAAIKYRLKSRIIS